MLAKSRFFHKISLFLSAVENSIKATSSSDLVSSLGNSRASFLFPKEDRLSLAIVVAEEFSTAQVLFLREIAICMYEHGIPITNFACQCVQQVFSRRCNKPRSRVAGGALL